MGQGQENADSIFDLIYVDHARVAVFLSQFGRFGNLTDQTRSVRETYQKTLSGGVAATIHASRETEQSAVEELQRHFDPQWLLPLTLLDQLEERRLICRDITKASLGQFVLCSGTLSILDFSILKKIWELPAIKKSITPTWERNLRQKTADGPQIKDFGEFARQILTVIPYNLQATIQSDNLEIWGSLKQEGMTIPEGEIFLKHGTSMPGVWNVLGLLDARPDATAQSPAAVPPPTGPALAQVLTTFVPALRDIVGRSRGSFGITPVVIFRQVVEDSSASSQS